MLVLTNLGTRFSSTPYSWGRRNAAPLHRHSQMWARRAGSSAAEEPVVPRRVARGVGAVAKIEDIHAAVCVSFVSGKARQGPKHTFLLAWEACRPCFSNLQHVASCIHRTVPSNGAQSRSSSPTHAPLAGQVPVRFSTSRASIPAWKEAASLWRCRHRKEVVT